MASSMKARLRTVMICFVLLAASHAEAGYTHGKGKDYEYSGYDSGDSYDDSSKGYDHDQGYDSGYAKGYDKGYGKHKPYPPAPGPRPPPPGPNPPGPNPPSPCPLGTYRSKKTMQCEPCPKGTYAIRQGNQASCAACPSGRTTLREGSLSREQCVCLAGFGRASGDSDTCVRCPQGTYSFGDAFDDCYECPFPKTTSFSGATSDKDCVCPGGGGTGPDCDQCPQNMILMANGICGCAPGHGGTTCELCLPGFYSMGGKPRNPRPICKPCGLHFTSPPGAISPAYCECQAGYGAVYGDTHSCDVCPIGSFNPGPGQGQRHIASLDGYGGDYGGGMGKKRLPRASPCRPCNAGNPYGGFTTIDVGAKHVGECVCAPGFGGPGCDPCPPATFSNGGEGAVCHSCPGEGAGYTTIPFQAASSVSACVCIPGYGMTDKGLCRICPAGTFSEGNSKEDCKPCPFGHTSAPGACGRDECVPASQPCPVGQVAPYGAVSSDQCVCLPGHGGTGSRHSPCAPCPAGSWSPGVDTQPCVPCGFGYTSPVASTSPDECYPINACPAGTQYPSFLKMPTSVEQCVCKSGYGSKTGAAPCHLCPAGTFSEGGNLEDCKPCPFGYKSAPGACGIHECVRTPQACPIGQWAPKDAVSVDQCACYPGFGGGSADAEPCDICPVGTFSPGFSRDRCIPCGFGYTSPIGAKEERDCYPIDQCPAGTEVPHGETGASKQECLCKPGFGSATGEGTCRLCPTASYSPGGTMEDCLPCPFGHTSRPGARHREECEPIPQPCPVGQVALLGAVSPAQCVCLPGHGGGRSPSDPCAPCPPGSWSSGRDTQPCVPCGFGYTSPEAATCPEECYPINACPAGTQYPLFSGVPVSIEQCVCKPGFGSENGKGICTLCPVGTFSEGGTMEDCKPCPFGFTSAPGACGVQECRPLVHACPIGQWAPFGAASAEECRCYKGFGGGETPTDACAICPAGTYSPGVGTERCVPCGFGFTSPEGACGPEECYPIDQCPVGTQPTDETLDFGGPQSAKECVCKPGFGAVVGEGGCHLCPAGTYGRGGTLEDCVPCPFGYTSAPGTTSWKGCVPAAQECPVGQLAPLGAVSREECGCLPGHGGGSTPDAACSLCPVGSWAAGGDTNPCIPCDFGYTSPEGATCAEECYPVNACPPGTIMPKYGASSAKECVCLPGYGTEAQEGPCSICPSGYYRSGFARGPCVPCPFGMTSPAGAVLEECVPMAQPCPVGQIVDPSDQPVSLSDCHCLPGFGGGDTPQDACHVCPVGTYNPGIGTQPCFPCPYGYTSPIGSLTPAACYEIEACPGGTLPAMETPSSTAECACIPGFGSPTGHIGDPCFWCPPDTFNEGFNWDGCKECSEGSWAPSGSPECYPIGEPGKSGNRTVSRGRAAPHTLAVSPSQYFKEWQTPKALPMAYMSVVEQQFTPIQHRQAQQQQQAQVQVTPAAPVTRKVRAAAQKPATNAIGQQPAKRRANMQRAGPINAQPAPAAGSMYAEMQMPAVPVSGLFDGSVPQMMAISAPADMATAEGMQSRNSAHRLGQAFSSMQGTSPAQGMSPNPAFSQPDAAAVPPPAAQHEQFMLLLQQREQLIQQQHQQHQEQQQRLAQQQQPAPATVTAPATGSLSGKNSAAAAPAVEKQTVGNATATAPTQPQPQQQQQPQQQSPAKAAPVSQPATQPSGAGAVQQQTPAQPTAGAVSVPKPTPAAAGVAPQKQQLPPTTAGAAAGAAKQTPATKQPAMPAVPGSNSSSASSAKNSAALNGSTPSNASTVASDSSSDRNISSSSFAGAIGGALDRPLAAVRKVVRRIVGSDGGEQPSDVSSADEAVRTVASARGKLHVNAS